MNRRTFLTGALSLLPLPAFVKAASLWLPKERPFKFAEGGIIDPARLVLLGNPERGNNETIIPTHTRRLRVPAGWTIDLEVGDQLMMRVEDGAIRVRPGTIREDL